MLRWLQLALCSGGQSPGCDHCQVACGWGQDGGRMVSVAPAVGGSSVPRALPSSSVEPGYPGTPVSQIHMKEKGECLRVGSQCKFPTLMTLIQAARWIQVTRESHRSKERGGYPVGMGGYCEPHRISSAWGSSQVQRQPSLAFWCMLSVWPGGVLVSSGLSCRSMVPE